jgi:hypothetical protein
VEHGDANDCSLGWLSVILEEYSIRNLLEGKLLCIMSSSVVEVIMVRANGLDDLCDRILTVMSS